MRNMFVLTKREQRVVIAIMMTLIAAVLANHYHQKWRDSAARSAAPVPSMTPAISSPEREGRESDDAP
ncbi:MAG TPA: hypothetical protein VFO30_08735 [Chthoniobacterales bacterium]|nr:hypothetical protein [Chthoniobacterales bacterium]